MMKGYQDLPMSHKRYLVAVIIGKRKCCEALAINRRDSYKHIDTHLAVSALGGLLMMSDRDVEELIEDLDIKAQTCEHADLGKFFHS